MSANKKILVRHNGVQKSLSSKILSGVRVFISGPWTNKDEYVTLEPDEKKQRQTTAVIAIFVSTRNNKNTRNGNNRKESARDPSAFVKLIYAHFISCTFFQTNIKRDVKLFFFMIICCASWNCSS